MSRPWLPLALSALLAFAAPVSAAPLSEDLSGRLASAREAYRATLNYPMSPAAWGARYNPPSDTASPLAAYERVLAEAGRVAKQPDPRDPHFKRKGLWVRPYAADASRARVLEVFDRAQGLGASEIYLETFFGGQVIYQKPNGVFPPKFAGLDVAKVYAAEAKRRGIKLHAWIHTLKWGAAVVKEHPEYLVRDGWGKDGTSTEGAYAFIVSPSHPGVRKALKDLTAEIAATGYYDGLILDYIRYPVRIKGDDVDESPEPRNFWGYSDAAQSAFFAENRPYDTPAFRRFLATGELDDEKLRPVWLGVWKNWLASEVEELIRGVRAVSRPRLQLSMAFFPSYYFHPWDNRAQESLRWMEHFDWVSPMCYSYFLGPYPDRFGHYNIDRELRIVNEGLRAYAPGERPEVVASLTEDPPGKGTGPGYHHHPFSVQLAYLKGRKTEGAYPYTRGAGFFSYGWLWPESDKERREGR